MSPTRRMEEQVQNQETQGKEMDDKKLDSMLENGDSVLLADDQVEGDVNKVKVLEVCTARIIAYS